MVSLHNRVGFVESVKRTPRRGFRLRLQTEHRPLARQAVELPYQSLPQSLGYNLGAGVNLERMAEASREAASAMSDIVWSIHPNQDKVGDLAQRMRRYAADLLESRGIEFDLVTPSAGALATLRLETRRDVMLIFKEAIHNAARHSGCTHVRAELLLQQAHLHISVEDNGRGGATPSMDGRGLRSMEARAQRLGGRFQIRSRAPSGTIVSVALPA